MFSGSFWFIRLTLLLLFCLLYDIMIYNNKKPGKEFYDESDKTEIIADLLRNHGDANLFTRPRRFGKT